MTDIAGQVFVRAGRRECTVQAEQQDFSSGEQLHGMAGPDLAIDDLNGDVGNRVAGLDGHVGLGRNYGNTTMLNRSVPAVRALEQGQRTEFNSSLFPIDRILAWPRDAQQEQAARDRYILVEIDHVRHALAIEHGPVVVADHGGGQRIQGKQEGERSRVEAKYDRDADEQLHDDVYDCLYAW